MDGIVTDYGAWCNFREPQSNKSCVEDDEKIREVVKFNEFKTENLHMFSYSSVHNLAIIHQKYSYKNYAFFTLF